MSTQTPAKLAAQRRTPALSLPPIPPAVDRQRRIETLEIRSARGKLPIGDSVVGDPPQSFALGETATLRIPLTDASGNIREFLTDQLTTVDGAVVTVDGIRYTVENYDGGRSLELTCGDAASWQMRLFRSHRAFPRTSYNRAQAVRELVREASSPPMVPISFWIPEIRDRQRVAKTVVERDGGPSTTRGAGRDADYTVKGVAATAGQRATIDAILTRCRAREAAGTVATCALMTATQESEMGEKPVSVSGKHLGPFHQDSGYGAPANRTDAAKATDGFLDEWKRVNGTIKSVPGTNKAAAIEKVQRSGVPSAYAAHEDEAKRTYSRWDGGNGDSDSTGSTAADDSPAVYEFSRGDRDGGRESSLTAIARWSEEVRWNWWTMLNTFCYASEDELRAAAPALHLDGDEPWLLSDLVVQGSATRTVDELTFEVLVERWGLLPGAAISIDRRLGVLWGRWIVSRVEPTLAGLRATVTVRRPVTPALEPSVEASSGGDSEDDGSGSSTGSLADRLYDACKQISDQGRDYLWGGGHSGAISQYASTRTGLDCSGSCSLALKLADMYPSSTAMVSGAFASSWGKSGNGRHFTVWANGTHVWIEFHGGGRDGHRFDTSPQGSGGRGPRLRTKERGHDGFNARRWEDQ